MNGKFVRDRQGLLRQRSSLATFQTRHLEIILVEGTKSERLTMRVQVKNSRAERSKIGRGYRLSARVRLAGPESRGVQ